MRGVDCNQFVDFNVEVQKPTWGMFSRLITDFLVRLFQSTVILKDQVVCSFKMGDFIFIVGYTVPKMRFIKKV